MSEDCHDSTNPATKPATMADVETIARVFSQLLRSQLTIIQLSKVNARNYHEPSDSQVCHSHDFCDANMVMLDALTELGLGAQFDPASEDDCRVWNAAWDRAKLAKFAL